MMEYRNETTHAMYLSLTQMVWSGVQIEGINATFEQTQALVERAEAKGLSERATLEIVGLKRAWEYLFHHLEEPISWELASEYNRILGLGTIPSAGELRSPGDVVVWGYLPEPYEPTEDVSINLFERIVGTALDSDYLPNERAAELFANIAKAQFFHNGNKRTALLLANHYLAQIDAGKIFVVPEQQADVFYDKLFDYYIDKISLDDIIWELAAGYFVEVKQILRQQQKEDIRLGDAGVLIKEDHYVDKPVINVAENANANEATPDSNALDLAYSGTIEGAVKASERLANAGAIAGEDVLRIDCSDHKSRGPHY